MSDRFSTAAGWALFAGIIALGGGIVGGKLFHNERPEQLGYVIEGVEAGGDGGAAAGPSLNTLMASADVAAGEKVFAKCAACHSIAQGGANGNGPNLWATLGKSHGHVGGFAYSDALKSVPGNWDFAAMDKWLKSPREYAPGTKMTFAGLGNPVDRANLIAYLNSMGTNLPMPAADAAPAPAGEAAANAAAPADNATVTNAAE